MFSKLAAVTLTMLGLGAYVLTTRQASLQARSEQTQAFLRVYSADDRLLELRSSIAMKVMPESVRHMALAAGVGELAPAVDELPPALALQGLGTIDQMRQELREELLAFRTEQSKKELAKSRSGQSSGKTRTPTSTSASAQDKKANAKPDGEANAKPNSNQSKPSTKPADKTKPASPSRIARNEL